MAAMAERTPTYTPESANALLPEVRDRAEKLREAHAVVAGQRARIATLASHNGGGAEAGKWFEASREMSRQLTWFSGAGIVVRDMQQGLIDFPAEREGRPIFLCWRLGEDAVAFWHPTDTGFTGRRPL